MESSGNLVSFLTLVGEDQLSEQEALRAIQAVELSGYLDADRALRWHFSRASSTEDHGDQSDEGVGPGSPPKSSNLWATITVHGQRFGFGPGSFTSILRGVFEQQAPLGVPRRTVAELCLAAGMKIESVPVEYSFASALAYCVELDDGDRAEARRLWEPYTLLTQLSWASMEFEALFIEASMEDSHRDFNDAERRTEGLLRDNLDWASGHDEPELQCVALRDLGLLHAGAGHIDEALSGYDEALALADRCLETTAKLVLLGDILWLAMRSQRAPKQQEASGMLAQELGSAESYVANAAVFERSALLCGAVGDSTGERTFISRISSCLS